MSQLGQRRGVSRVLEIQDAPTEATTAAIQRFGEAFNRHDLDAVMAAMTEDCVLESTFPQPDGTRYEGQDAIRAYWEELFRFFRSCSQAVFETEEMFAAGDRCVFRWIYRWVDRDGKPGHLRGIDVFRVRDGKVAEKLVYAKANP